MKPAWTNRLAREKSPYLLQHQHNPVDWWAWGDEAFARARIEQKPIFLSIGYSTCHWCHVMERESFEDTATAAFLNAHFVSIKVDREERPDVDQIYMTFLQATTGEGGWPLTVFLTPELRPFFGGTYFAPQPRYGRPGFLQVLEQIHQLWTTRRPELTEAAAKVHAHLDQATVPAQSRKGVLQDLDAGLLRSAGLRLKGLFDPRHGGFGGAPKFPQPSQTQLLLRYAERFSDNEALGMVRLTCDRMAAGGIHDQLGGGFARYSVDAEWRVPHFEKMLYDQAQLAELYLDAFLACGEPRHAEVARDILDYVLRDLADPAGGFYSAEDADSEGHEGKFYCWTQAELSELLSPEEFELATRVFGITRAGNFIDHSHPEPLPDQNVLSLVAPPLSAAEAACLASLKRKLLDARSRRVRPQRDDKVLASWNGLMLGAFARAHAVLGDAVYRAAAENNLAFLQQTLWEPPSTTAPGTTPATGALYHRWREGERDDVQLLEAYAFLLPGVIDLYEATLDPAHLRFAIDLADALLARFFDADAGGFWQSDREAPDLILRLKAGQDGALPSGNSAAILGLLRLGVLTDRTLYTRGAQQSLQLFVPQLTQNPLAFPAMLLALDYALTEPKRVVVAGDPATSAGCALLRAIHSVYQPNKAVLGTTGEVSPLARALSAGNGPIVHVCTETACQPPTSDPATLSAALK